MTGPEIDPKGLIREAYRIEGITGAECRSIFMDWALSLPESVPATEALTALIARHAVSAPNHPMSTVLREGLAEGRPANRRGGWRGRRGAGKTAR
ncbi:hypothetical protein [Tropicimonas sp. IMCC6043]|uniref:hypothetical protein n=1 Tax=Tropicimonas sp. IMCC6043 TaxID=2510645 RepID=UPI00101E0C66|nr:hypothetical protein [Tropicimonas sp. IMCC6043]RYH10182.1 hypothetical protein EU800_09880 [Tropicimonas sp. IMCC6043]